MGGDPVVGLGGGVDARAHLLLDGGAAEAVHGQVVRVERQVAEGGIGHVPGAAVDEHGHDVARREQRVLHVGPRLPVGVDARDLG